MNKGDHQPVHLRAKSNWPFSPLLHPPHPLLQNRPWEVSWSPLDDTCWSGWWSTGQCSFSECTWPGMGWLGQSGIACFADFFFGRLRLQTTRGMIGMEESWGEINVLSQDGYLRCQFSNFARLELSMLYILLIWIVLKPIVN